MDRHTFRFYEETFEGNFFEILFRYQIGLPVEIFEDNQWVTFNNWDSARDILTEIQKRCSNRKYFYAGLDVIVQIDEATLICAILSSPFDTHTVRLHYGFDWHDWKQIHQVYHLVKKFNLSDSKFPNYDASNPMASSINPTPFQCTLWKYNPRTITKFKWGTYVKYGDGSFECRPTEAYSGIIYPSTGVLKSKGGIVRHIRWSKNRIYQVIQEDLLTTRTSYIPYVGTLTIKNGTLRFSSARLLRDRIHNRNNKNPKRQGIRDYGGERQPSQSPFLWAHRNYNDISRRRQFVSRMKNIGISNIVYQAFIDSLYVDLRNGNNVTIRGIGTLRVNVSKRISFRTSPTFRKKYKEHTGEEHVK